LLVSPELADGVVAVVILRP